MKPLAVAAAVTLSATAASAETNLNGIWRTATYMGDYAFVRFGPCSGKICGVVTRTFGPNGEIQGGSLGKTIVINMEPVGGGEFANGRIRRPDTGQSAPLTLQVNGGTMNVSACIGPLCRNETWTRVQ
ncbi:DUF2147 domain-containing protein [Maritimibacter sp. UBA3975]|uniref:DUF2147 domain-containing protein n=1 Tax=Maritimibacter sp. UBA3975 TaxID=1946833 RepID=UPI0025C54081|nr:DUF2147 domain-containing protein [Maritimibacter sp. UBA3975]|tara:strand:+ start:19892 stop:20275 length:384 start_codon:yes stop_codon:yes gene_type:complete